jgi:hypothetical protein
LRDIALASHGVDRHDRPVDGQHVSIGVQTGL